MQRYLAAVAAVALATLNIAAPAIAGDVRTTYVSTAGLDLASRAGAAELDARLMRAAKAVCAPDRSDLRELTRSSACRAQALSGARAKAATVIAAAQMGGASRVAALQGGAVAVASAE